jgi:RNA polymerase sigma-70 factor (ECF subfamily)
MELREIEPHDGASAEFLSAWRAHRGYVRTLATRTLGDPAEAEDVVQETFDRLSRVDLEELDDIRGWLAVVARRLCLDRIRSAYARRESVAQAPVLDQRENLHQVDPIDPADRVTLDDEIQVALAVVLDRLTPAERTAFVLHDVFGFPYAAVGEIVGRTPAACRQLASRARRSVRSGEAATRPRADTRAHRALAEQFIAACKGGDIGALMATLDPAVDGDATLLGFGPLPSALGRPAIAQRLLGLFGPQTDAVLVPVAVEHDAGVIALVHRRLAAVVRLHEVDGFILHIHAVVFPPA